MQSTSTDIRNCASILLKSMKHASLAFKEMSEIKLEATDIDQSKVFIPNSNQIRKDLSVNISRNVDEDVPLAFAVQETFVKDQTHSSLGSTISTSTNVQKLTDDNTVNDISHDKEHFNSFGPVNINVPSLRTQNLGNYTGTWFTFTDYNYFLYFKSFVIILYKNTFR